MIERAMLDDSKRGLRKAGGQLFLDRLASLSFELSSRKAQEYLFQMRYRARYSQKIMDEFGLKLCDALLEATCTTSKYLHSNWCPTSEQTAELAYQKAVRCRLGGNPSMLCEAEDAVKQALISMPGSVEYMLEKERIAKWRKEL